MIISRHRIALLSGIIILAAVVLWGANQWVENKIRSLLDAHVEAGNLSYKSLAVNIYTNRARLRELHWTERNGDLLSKDIRFEEVKIAGFSFGKYLFNDKIEIAHVEWIRPRSVFYPFRVDTTNQSPQTGQEEEMKDISIDKTVVVDGSLKYFKKDSAELTFSGHFPGCEVEDIRIDSATLSRPIPFRFGDSDITADSLFYRINDLYDLTVHHMTAKNDHLLLDSLIIRSPYDRYEFQSHIPHEKSWADLLIPHTEIDGIQWDVVHDTIAFSASMIRLTDGNLYLYKDNRLPDNPHFKPLYSRSMRELPIKVDVDSIAVVDADVTFQLQTKKEPPPGNVYFRGINGYIAHLTNVGMKEAGFLQTVISAEARFMKESTIHLDWAFDIANPRDSLTVSGRLSRIGAEGINYFIVPSLNISAEGAIDRLAFNFAADNTYATGDMFIRYDDMRINLLRKDGRERSAWMSAILHVLLKNKLDGPVEKKNLRIERIQTKSFWNYLWEMVKAGTLESVI